jgi:hypothetical protein
MNISPDIMWASEDRLWVGVDEFVSNFRLSCYKYISERIPLFLYSFPGASVLPLLCIILLHLISVYSTVSEEEEEEEDDDEGPEYPLPISASAETPPAPPPPPPRSRIKWLRLSALSMIFCTCWFRGLGTDCGNLSVDLTRRNLLSAIDIDVHGGFHSY